MVNSMLRRIIKYEKLGPFIDNNLIEIRGATFKKDIGPWKTGHYVNRLRWDIVNGTIMEIDNSDNIINAQQMCLITRNPVIEKMVEWLDDEEANEHLYTKEGVRVYRIYENTELIRTIRRIDYEIGN